MKLEKNIEVNSFPGLIFRPKKAGQKFRINSKNIRRYLIAPLLFVLIFILINTDLESVRYFFWSRISSESVRKVEISGVWIKKYSIIINNKMSVRDDSDGDGLNFMEEMSYNSNPFSADSDSDGTKDSDEIKNGTNPAGSGILDMDNDKMPDNWEKEKGLLANKNDAVEDNDSDGLKNIDEYSYGTNPKSSDSDSDGYKDYEEIRNGYDPDAPGDARPKVVLLSEKIQVAAPMVWSRSDDIESMEKDLEKGVAHYPKSGVPGQIGNVIVTGHSSNYAWAKGEYNSIFKDLGNLAPEDAFIFRVIYQNGKTFDYEYKITEKKVVSPDDQWIFESFDSEQVLTLGTCWPIGTDISRLVIRAKRG